MEVMVVTVIFSEKTTVPGYPRVPKGALSKEGNRIRKQPPLRVPASETQLLRTDRVAKILDVSRRRVYTLIDEGKLEALRIGQRQLRVTRQGLEDFITKRKKARRVELGLEE